MNPRLKTSKKWTAFPKEYQKQIEEVFRENFKKQLGDHRLLVEGRIYSEEILLRIGIQEKGRLAQTNFEVSMNYSAKTKDAVERIHDCIDAAASMMSEYYEAQGEIDFPRLWKEYEFNGRKLYLQFSTENSDLEAQADALLGQEFNDQLMKEEASSDSDDVEAPPSSDLPGPEKSKKKKKSDLH